MWILPTVGAFVQMFYCYLHIHCQNNLTEVFWHGLVPMLTKHLLVRKTLSWYRMSLKNFSFCLMLGVFHNFQDLWEDSVDSKSVKSFRKDHLQVFKTQLTVSTDLETTTDVQDSSLHTDHFLHMDNWSVLRKVLQAQSMHSCKLQCGYCCGSDVRTSVPVFGTQNWRVQASVCPSAEHRQVLQSFL